MTGRSRVLVALATVRDPELDESIVPLGFVASCEVSDDGDATVTLRLPTYFCAPNFAFLMVADAYDAVSALEGLRCVRVELEDHFAAAIINEGVAARAGFAGSFGEEAAGELDELRAGFLRKAVLAGTEQVCRPLLAEGRTPGELADMTLAEIPPSARLDRLRGRRAELGLPAGPSAPLLLDPATGTAVAAEGLPLHLRKARTVRVGIEANTGICRGMLRHRYSTPGQGEAGEAERRDRQ
ncbi:metal-sulfur cluster biosynthetic enzyme [Amycolatopsis antarctica]|uniref:Metal-sulfur cluster biosynthetic enzyme n=2 Tax=Amycolatopsis antarctica TaxID=1854586 RepID=A0A263D2Q5_9PSEU|nr:metal-sulfur cluster biosynthetic enzyme [Amycolatopsis antarctica]